MKKKNQRKRFKGKKNPKAVKITRWHHAREILARQTEIKQWYWNLSKAEKKKERDIYSPYFLQSFEVPVEVIEEQLQHWGCCTDEARNRLDEVKIQDGEGQFEGYEVINVSNPHPLYNDTVQQGIAQDLLFKTMDHMLMNSRIIHISEKLAKHLDESVLPKKLTHGEIREAFILPYRFIWLEVDIGIIKGILLGCSRGYENDDSEWLTLGFMAKASESQSGTGRTSELLGAYQTRDDELWTLDPDGKKYLFGYDFLRIGPETMEFDSKGLKSWAIKSKSSKDGKRLPKIEKLIKDSVEKATIFALKFMMFMHHPDVNYRETIVSDSVNEKHKAKNRKTFSKENRIQITGKLRLQLEAAEQNTSGDRTKRAHWRRGHYRILRNVDYWGDSAGKRIWIPPCQIGEGIPLSSEYEAKEKS